ncbi:sugar phosphate isomerase/epimerase family protein [Roseibium sp.]|uniref:sugar phosphate isomerase/epimerase family protein n=1 Tax=Roseibium sp. TaxID=1936156 RepID=UPI003A98696B
MTALGDRFAINTYSYTQSMSASECVRHLSDCGVEEFELMCFPGHLWVTDGPDAMKDLRKALSDKKVVSLNTSNIDLNVAAAFEEMRSATLDLNQGFLHMGADLGAEALILGPGKPNPLFPLAHHQLEGHFFSALDTLLPLADRLGVEIWVENMPFAFLPDASGLMASLERYGRSDLKVCYDAANAHFIGEDPVAGLREVASRLALVHLSDTTRNVYRHDAVGDGDLDFSALPAALSAVGYKRRTMLEIISRNPDLDLPRSVTALQDMGF